MGRKVLGRIHPVANLVLRNEVFPVLREDNVVNCIRYDELVILYGNKLCDKYRQPHHYTMIRQRLRLVGRFLLSMKELSPNEIDEFCTILRPKYYDTAIKAVNKVAAFDAGANSYAAPSVASSLGTMLKKMCNLYITECIKKELLDKKQKTIDFLKLLEEDYPTSVNKTVLENQLQFKRQKKITLPSTDDIKKLNVFLRDNRRKYFSQLMENYSYEAWKSLAEYTLISIQLFNRRRAGEIERILINDFNNQQKISENTHKDVYNALSSEGKMAVQKYVRFVIRGKLARGVPVLLYHELLESVNLILLHRTQAGVPDENPYLFDMPGHNKHLQACVLMRKFAKDCGATMNETLRGTQLRKQIATKSVLMDLKETEISELANFMGHADKIHKEHYRLPIEAREITNISKLLEIAQGEDSLSSDEEDIEIQESNSNECEDTENSSKKVKETRSVSPIGNVKRKSWSFKEIKEAKNEFAWNIANAVLPSLSECCEAVKKYESFSNRSPTQIKLWVSNQINKNKKLKAYHSTPHKKLVSYNTWNENEMNALYTAFKTNMDTKKVPSLKECEDARKMYEPLKNRSTKVIKAAVFNQINRQNK